MTRLIVALSLVMAACSHPAPPPAIEAPPSFDQVNFITCNELYQHIVDIGVIQVNGDGNLSPEALRAAREQVDNRYQENGITGKFYAYCRDHATTQQLSCAMRAMSLREIDRCFKP